MIRELGSQIELNSWFMIIIISIEKTMYIDTVQCQLWECYQDCDTSSSIVGLLWCHSLNSDS